MKVIDYEKTSGYFKIKYIEDSETINGSINVDQDSVSNNAVVTKLIINNYIGDVVTIEDKNNIQFEIVEKDIKIIYKEVSEYDFFESFNIYNERVPGIETKYINVSENYHISPANILFQFYYKNAESEEKGTPSYILKNIFSKDPRTSDELSPEGYFNEFDILCRTFKTNFLAKHDFNTNDYLFCCLPNNKSLKLIVEEITKRDVKLDINDVLVNNDYKLIKDKKIILLDGIIFDDRKLLEYKDKLLQEGASSVIMYAFGKASIKL